MRCAIFVSSGGEADGWTLGSLAGVRFQASDCATCTFPGLEVEFCRAGGCKVRLVVILFPEDLRVLFSQLSVLLDEEGK